MQVRFTVVLCPGRRAGRDQNFGTHQNLLPQYQDNINSKWVLEIIPIYILLCFKISCPNYGLHSNDP